MLPGGATCFRGRRAFANSVNRQWIASASGWLKPAIPFPPGNRPRSLGGPRAREQTLLTNNFLKIVRLTVNSGIGLQDNYAPISSALIGSCGYSNYQIQRGYVPRIGLPLIKHYMDGLLFFGDGRELRIVAYDVSRTNAVVHADGLGLLPISFYVTIDDFLTVGKCRLAWRYRDDIGVVFERWLDVRQRIARDQAR